MFTITHEDIKLTALWGVDILNLIDKHGVSDNLALKPRLGVCHVEAHQEGWGGREMRDAPEKDCLGGARNVQGGSHLR